MIPWHRSQELRRQGRRGYAGGVEQYDGVRIAHSKGLMHFLPARHRGAHCSQPLGERGRWGPRGGGGGGFSTAAEVCVGTVLDCFTTGRRGARTIAALRNVTMQGCSDSNRLLAQLWRSSAEG